MVITMFSKISIRNNSLLILLFSMVITQWSLELLFIMFLTIIISLLILIITWKLLLSLSYPILVSCLFWCFSYYIKRTIILIGRAIIFVDWTQFGN